MASETKRGCGYRKVGGMYLVGNYVSVSCDRLPYPLEVCPVCGAGIKVGRGLTKINPLKLFDTHIDCSDKFRPCFMCDPKDEPAYIMGVGEKYYPTPEHFIQEGVRQGFSKRIAQIPKEFEIGKTVIYLAHPKACEIREPVAVQQAMNILEAQQPTMIDTDKVKKTTGIFTVFIPQRIEKLYWQSELGKMSDKEKEKLTKRGITPIGIPDGDKDHA